MSTTKDGRLQQFTERKTKTGKPYISFIVGDLFVFYWGDKDDLKICEDNEGDEVRLLYTDGKFPTAKQCEVIKQANVDLSEDDMARIKKAAEECEDIDALIENIGQTTVDVATKQGIITVSRTGEVKVLE